MNASIVHAAAARASSAASPRRFASTRSPGPTSRCAQRTARRSRRPMVGRTSTCSWPTAAPCSATPTRPWWTPSVQPRRRRRDRLRDRPRRDRRAPPHRGDPVRRSRPLRRVRQRSGGHVDAAGTCPYRSRHRHQGRRPLQRWQRLRDVQLAGRLHRRGEPPAVDRRARSLRPAGSRARSRRPSCRCPGTTCPRSRRPWRVHRRPGGGRDHGAHRLQQRVPDADRPVTWPRARDLAHEAGALLLFDEVLSGFKTGLGGAQALYGVTPDLTMLSKAMSSGVPLSAWSVGARSWRRS